MDVKMSSVVKQLLYVLKLFRVTAGCIHSFRIRSKETFRIMYPKYPVLDMIQRILLRYGSFGSIIRFSILVKKPYIRSVYGLKIDPFKGCLENEDLRPTKRRPRKRRPRKRN